MPFAINVLTHSRQRYRRNLRFYADDPTIRVGGPTYHWVRESILAGEQVLAGAGDDATPTLLLQAEEERVVDNRMHDRFCELRTAAGHPVEGGRPLVIKGAYHEILFEKDAMRSVALHAIVDFFNRHNSPSRKPLYRGVELMCQKLFCLSLDGTLLSPDHTLSPYAKETLKLLTARGINFVFATGRHHVDVGQIHI